MTDGDHRSETDEGGAAVADGAVTDALDALASRYRRRERLLSALAVALALLPIVVVLPIVPFVAVLVAILAVVVALRVPLWRSAGRLSLRTDADPDAVRAAFAGPRPPALALQWATADDVAETDDGARYEFAWLAGLATATMTVTVDEDPDAGVDGDGDATVSADATDGDGDADATDATASPDDTDATDSTDEDDPFDGPGPLAAPDLRLSITAGDRPWGIYDVAFEPDGAGTAVTVATRSDRAFGVRRLPQWWLARRYRERVFGAQGYDVVEVDGGLRPAAWLS